MVKSNKKYRKLFYHHLLETLDNYDVKKECKFGLLSGDLGLCLLSEVFGMREAQVKSHQVFLSSVSTYNNLDKPTLNLHNGLASIHWIVKYMKWESKIEDFENIESMLIRTLDTYLDQGNFDLLYGANGLMVTLYSDSSRRHELIVKYLKALELNRRDDKYGIFWASNGGEVVNFGLAHGLCSIIMVLLKYRDVEKVKIDRMINSIYDSIMNRLLFEDVIKVPCAIAKDGRTFYDEGFGWCFGRLSVGYCFLKTGSILENSEMKQLGLRMIDEGIYQKRSFRSYQHKYCLCHGDTSKAYMLKKVFDITNHPKYIEESVKIIDKINEELFRNNKLNENYSSSRSILTGFSGYFLAAHEIEMNTKNPKWNEILLL
ncbi:MAG: hypothetical protein LBF27_31220 [Sphingobacterium sp.]|jgi:hypothetical protein|nr:hypothetical protein [Sphingobacterium sp.]